MSRDKDDAPKPAEAHFTPVNEQVVLAAAMVDAEARARLAHVLRPEDFLVESHRPAWAALQELTRRKLDFDFAALRNLGDRVDVPYLQGLLELRPDAPSPENLGHHVAAMQWDRRRATAVQGPFALLHEAIRDPSESPERVRALARQVADSFAGAGRSHNREPGALVAEMMGDLRRRREGRATWPYGVAALDFYEEGARDRKGNDLGGRARMLPGAAPGLVTVVTGFTGGGKSTVAAVMALGIAAQERRVLYGSWEPSCPMTLELLATLSLGWSRSDLTEGQFSDEDERQIEERAHDLSKWIVLMENPFQLSRGGKESNDRNLDLVHQHIVDSACDVFIADLWDRCVVDDHPNEEKRALWRQHSIAEETRTHNILLAQQKIKDDAQRADMRPTLKGILGSQAWSTMPETAIGIHRPALFKNTDDNRLEAIILKQRWGVYPQAVEFDWDAEFGSIENGRSIPFEHANEGGAIAEFIAPGGIKGKGRRRPSRA